MRLIFILIILVPIFSTNQSALLAVEAKEAEDIVNISNYQGQVVYLDFWASWCIPCRKSFPWLNKIRQMYSKKQLTIVAVNLDKDPELAADFLKKYPASFGIVYDQAGLLAKKYQIPGMPSSILFDHNGKVIGAHSGFFKKKIDQYEQTIANAISQLPNTINQE